MIIISTSLSEYIPQILKLLCLVQSGAGVEETIRHAGVLIGIHFSVLTTHTQETVDYHDYDLISTRKFVF